ncbi:MAG: L-threonylcarbamoyladenylate synthase [Acidobacteriota bacterium]|nr:L-threonylcarbamoyladenylate synthase [Acidobacteriota bacterium]
MTVHEAGAAIRAGKLVAFPTETVYGLGANAFDADAVRGIFEIKGRPSTSPLIVHVANIEIARDLVRSWPAEAETLARQFWPGPLTLVLPKQDSIPDIVTAGLSTVGLRMPAHPLALDLLREARVPVAAPSANRFTELSPTTADHVRQAFGGQIEFILDGGPCDVGIESTVLSLVNGPELLRPGMISREQIESIIGPIALAEQTAEGPHASPGQHPRHYRPRTPLLFGRPPVEGRGAYLWIHESAGAHLCIKMPSDAAAYAAQLYQTLHELDRQSLDWIAVEPPPAAPAWLGVADRLRRASTLGTNAPSPASNR